MNIGHFLRNEHGNFLSNKNGRFLSNEHGTFFSDKHETFLSNEDGRLFSTFLCLIIEGCIEQNAPGKKLSRFLKMGGGGGEVVLGYSFITIISK